MVIVTFPSWWWNIWANLLTRVSFSLQLCSLQLCRPTVAFGLCWSRTAEHHGIIVVEEFFLIPETQKHGKPGEQLGVPLSCLQAYSRWLNFLPPGSPLQPLLPFPKSTTGQRPTFEPVDPWEMFKGQTVKCSFERTRMHFKTEERWLMTLSERGGATSSQGGCQSSKTRLYPASDAKEELSFHPNWMWRKLIFKMFSCVTKCVFFLLIRFMSMF